jgi:hypothetical protein
MFRHSLFLLAAVACLATAPAMAQQPAAPPPTQGAPPPVAGPRLQPAYGSYQPVLAQQHEAPVMAAAAAADRTVITISTLGLVLLAVLLIIVLT